MKKKLIGLLGVVFLVALPLAAIAGQGGMGGMNGMQGKDGMPAMNNNMIVLSTQTVDGVKGMGHLMKAMKGKDSMGMQATHDFMLVCSDAKTGAFLSDGLVALKVTDPAGHTSAPMKLMPMKMGMVKGFGVGVNLTEKGTYKFEVGSKLADGEKRQFEFSYTAK